MDKKSYRIDELAKEWHVSRETVRREINRGELDAFRVGHNWRIKQESVEEYEKKTGLNDKKSSQ